MQQRASGEWSCDYDMWYIELSRDDRNILQRGITGIQLSRDAQRSACSPYVIASSRDFLRILPVAFQRCDCTQYLMHRTLNYIQSYASFLFYFLFPGGSRGRVVWSQGRQDELWVFQLLFPFEARVTERIKSLERVSAPFSTASYAS